jgi:tetratricopeptide (TPR) repeat protein
MPWPYNRKWRPSRWWELQLENRIERVLRRMDLSPEAALRAAQSALRFHLRKGGPDAPATTTAMVQGADQLKRQERYAEELLLREQIVGNLRRNLGLEHENTLRAEAHLGRCLLDLDRAEDAEPLLAHVLAESTHSPGTMSPDTCDAILCLAVVHRKSGRLDEARQLLEQVLSEYAQHGLAEGTAAMDVSWLLAAILFKLEDLEEATLLYRHILDVRGRTLGPDDPETLESLELLIRILVRTENLAEARVMAFSLVEKRTQILGEEDAETTSARELLASLDPPDEPSSD